MSGAAQAVEGQPREALPFGLFSTVHFRETDRVRWENGVEWESLVCAPVSGVTAEDAACIGDLEYFFRDSCDVGEAHVMTVWGAVKYGVGTGRSLERAEEAAQALLLAREEAQVEALLWQVLLDSAPTDVHSGGAVSPALGLALLEDWIGQVYGSLGVVHASRAVASLLDTAVSSRTNRLVTTLGTPVVAGAGYGSYGTPTATTTWVHATPALFGYRGSVFKATSFDHDKNDMYAVASRQYVVGFDPCGVGAVRVDQTA
jgi:hypothetical protein